MKITSKERSLVNAALIEKGLDGNGRFESPGEALRKAQEALDLAGLTLTLITGSIAPRDDRESINKRFDLETVENSALAAHFYYHQAIDRFEVVAYLS